MAKIVWIYWRVVNGKCPRCSKTICDCSSWCKCSIAQLEQYYSSVWVKIDAPLEWIKQEWKTVDLIMWEIQDLKKLWYLLREELHQLPLHIKNIWGKYDAQTVIDINNYLSAFKVKLTCDECKQHFTDYIRSNPFVWEWVIDLFHYINDFHNAVNQRLSKPIYQYETKIVGIARDLQKKWLINWLDIFKTNWWFNV